MKDDDLNISPYKSPVEQRNKYPTEAENHYIHAATSDNTRRTYQGAIKRFIKWGGLLPANKSSLVNYLTAHAAELNPRTLSIHMTAISQWHQTQQIDDPTSHPDVRKTLKGIHKTHGKPKQKAKALRLEHLATMLKHLDTQPDSAKIRRDKALLLIGFFGAFRRSELVAIEFGHLIFEPEGLIISIEKSKTDQLSEGIQRAIPMNEEFPDCCPVKALHQWLEMAEISQGAVFRGISRWGKIMDKPLYAGSISDILKSLAAQAGLDFAPELSAHSFRRGLSTSASRENVDFGLIKQQGGWKNDDMVRGYIEEGRLLEENPAHALFESLKNF
ncbi:MAG: site-specific integrase [Cellvibrionales bacterium]|nr:site-specific integrase [Cellvibrionales bacterium]